MSKSFDEFSEIFINEAKSLSQSADDPIADLFHNIREQWTKDFLKILKAYHEEFNLDD